MGVTMRIRAWWRILTILMWRMTVRALSGRSWRIWSMASLWGWRTMRLLYIRLCLLFLGANCIPIRAAMPAMLTIWCRIPGRNWRLSMGIKSQKLTHTPCASSSPKCTSMEGMFLTRHSTCGIFIVWIWRKWNGVLFSRQPMRKMNLKADLIWRWSLRDRICGYLVVLMGRRLWMIYGNLILPLKNGVKWSRKTHLRYDRILV